MNTRATAWQPIVFCGLPEGRRNWAIVGSTKEQHLASAGAAAGDPSEAQTARAARSKWLRK
jgi:hypothetical protein